MNKFSATVVIGCDLSTTQMAETLRAILEQFSLRVFVIRLYHKKHIEDFLAGDIPNCDYTILCCHGMGERDEDAQIMLKCIHNTTGDDTRKDGWEEFSLVLKPSDIDRYLQRPQGTFINLACGGGREVWAKAFLDAGYKSYIGATRDYVDMNASVLFIAGFFYHLLMPSCDYTDKSFTSSEAVQEAAAMDKHYDWGTQLFRYYERF